METRTSFLLRQTPLRGFTILYDKKIVPVVNITWTKLGLIAHGRNFFGERCECRCKSPATSRVETAKTPSNVFLKFGAAEAAILVTLTDLCLVERTFR